MKRKLQVLVCDEEGNAIVDPAFVVVESDGDPLKDADKAIEEVTGSLNLGLGFPDDWEES